MREVGGLHPVIQILPFGVVTVVKRTPVLDDVAAVGVDVIMVFQIMRIRRLLQIIDTPVFAVQKHDRGARAKHIHIQMASHTMTQSVVQSNLKPIAASERFEVHSFDIVNRGIVKETMLKAFFPIFLSGIELHALLLIPS